MSEDRLHQGAPFHRPDLGPATRAVHSGQRRTPQQEQSEPLYLSSSFAFRSAAEAAATFAGEEAGASAEGNVYSRYTNPTVATFERRLAALEGAERAVATSSGMGAVLTLCLSQLSAGDTLLSSRQLFGTTLGLFGNYLPRMGVQVRYLDLTDLPAWEQALAQKPRLAFVELPSNPLSRFADLRRLAAACAEHGVILAADSCFLTPALFRPLELGADLVVHSATKHIDGQGRCLGGVIAGRAQLVEECLACLRVCGTTMSAFNAWVFLKGLETLPLRMRATSAAALQLAQWLEQHPRVGRVHYLGLPSHPDHALAADLPGHGSVVAFEVQGGREAAWRLIDATALFSITANFGDAKSTTTHPATTTHGRLTPEQKQESGIAEGLVRICVGLEDPEDLRADLDRALAAA